MVASPGHRLGQAIGNFVQDLFITKLDESLADICREHSYYCDKQGLRPRVRGTKKKLTWEDKYGNKHDMDYVVERDASYEEQGRPVAFIEFAWRRYTKHSRNKTGELEGSLLPLYETYQETCTYVAAIIAGEYTTGGIDQLENHGIKVLPIPYSVIAATFKTKGIDLDYSEDASNEHKTELLRQLERLTEADWEDIRQELSTMIQEEYQEFVEDLRNCIRREVKSVRILGLFGEEVILRTTTEAIERLESYSIDAERQLRFMKFEVYVRFNNGSRLEGAFTTKAEAIAFLRLIEIQPGA